MTLEEIVAKVTEALTALGTTPDEVAENLRREIGKTAGTGIHDCPIATYINKLIGGSESGFTACVSYEQWSLHGGSGEGNDLPTAVRQFIGKYDGRLYPFLNRFADEPEEPSPDTV